MGPEATLTNTIVANVTIGEGASDGVVSPDNSTLYVTSNLANSVAVIDTATSTVTHTLQISIPTGIAITPDGSTVYVAGANGISVIATSTETISQTIGVETPTGVTVSPDGKSVYVIDSAGIQIISVATNTVTGNIPQLGGLQVLFDPSGASAWVLCVTGPSRHNAYNLGGVLRVDTQSLKTEQFLWGSLFRPTTAAIAPNGGKLYIGLPHKIVIFDTVTKSVTGDFPITNFEGGAYGIPAVTSNGAYLYYPMSENILVIDTATGANAGVPIPLFVATFLTIAPNGARAYAGTDFGSPNSHGGALAIDIGYPPSAR